jgi:hypothetical protein
MTSRLDIPNDWQHVGRKSGCLRLAGHTHPLNGAGRVGRTHRFALAAARAAMARSEIPSPSFSARRL